MSLLWVYTSLQAQSNIEHMHPSIPLDFKLLELWRIHPTWNIDGCLTFSFLNETLSWEHCDIHFKRCANAMFESMYVCMYVCKSRNSQSMCLFLNFGCDACVSLGWVVFETTPSSSFCSAWSPMQRTAGLEAGSNSGRFLCNTYTTPKRRELESS